MYKHTLFNLEESKAFAKKLGALLIPGDVVLFKGDLGAGKSTLIRALIQSLCGETTEVPSPSFTLVQTYEAPSFEIWHFYFYRLEDPEEIFELGIEEAFQSGVSLIEWPERLGSLMPKNHLLIEITQGLNDDERFLTIIPTDLWHARANALIS